jgi:site-specific recombinase XerD
MSRRNFRRRIGAETSHIIINRDSTWLGCYQYRPCRRAAAAAKLRLGDSQHDGTQYVLRFQQKGGKSREIPVRHDLEGFILAYVDAAGLTGEAKDSPLFRASNGRSRTLTAKSLGTERICELVKRWLKDAGLPSRLSPYSFRVKSSIALS